MYTPILSDNRRRSVWRSRSAATTIRALAASLGLIGLNLGAETSCAEEAPANNTVYHLFVRSFYDSDGDKVGDLRGLAQKLDYLNDGDPATDDDLEVGVLWLMPIFPTKSYHGYDVTDYRGVNPEYGTLSDLKTLVDNAHQRGMRIILDIPFNHTSNEHPWFKQAVESKAPFRSYYHMWPDDGHGGKHWHTTENRAGSKLKYFGAFGYIMPDLNFDTGAVRSEVKQIAQFWLELGVDGFRLDAAKHIFPWTNQLSEADILRNNGWWRAFSDHVYGLKPNAVLVGEVLGEPYLLFRHAWGLNALIDDPFMHAARAQIAEPKRGFVSRWKAFLGRAEAENPDAPYTSFIFLSSHDKNPRLASELEQKVPGSLQTHYRFAMCMLLSMGQYPILYYGDELMQRGWKWNGSPANSDHPGDGSNVYDETLREPFPWYKSGDGPGQTNWQPGNHTAFLPKFDRPNDGVSVEEQEAAGTIVHLVRGLTNLRAELPSFANGNLGRVLTDSNDWMVFERVKGQERYLVLLNPTAQGRNYGFHERWYPEYRGTRLLFWSDGQGRTWKDLTGGIERIHDSVYVPRFGMVLLGSQP